MRTDKSILHVRLDPERRGVVDKICAAQQVSLTVAVERILDFVAQFPGYEALNGRQFSPELLEYWSGLAKRHDREPAWILEQLVRFAADRADEADPYLVR